MLFYSLTIFLSAFLLFEVQPVIAKMILPWFGGSSAVWSTCMLFFQIVLLLGYVYAHLLHRTLSPRRQAMIHIGRAGGEPGRAADSAGGHWKTGSHAQPSLRILALLAVDGRAAVFPAVVHQPAAAGVVRADSQEGLPYRLFALSNFASLLALLSYPGADRAEPGESRAGAILVRARTSASRRSAA